MPQRLGIDVSHHNNENSAQHKIDWNKVAADRAYHFMRVGNSGKAQAETFLSAAKLDAGNLLPSLDVEVLPGSSEARKAFLGKIGAWLDIVSTKIGGKQPFIYTRKSMSDDLTKDKTFADYPLWVAN